MFFSFENPYKFTTKQAHDRILLSARARILLFPMRSNELVLNEYFTKNNKITLKQVCLKLLRKIKVAQNSHEEIILTFADEESDNLAAFITYGNTEVHGSQILKIAFKDA